MDFIRTRLAAFFEWLSWWMGDISQALDPDTAELVCDQEYEVRVKRNRQELEELEEEDE